MEIAGLDCLHLLVGLARCPVGFDPLGLIEYNILSDRLFPDCITRITMAEPPNPPKEEIPQIQGYSRTTLFQNNEAASRWYTLLP